MPPELVIMPDGSERLQNGRDQNRYHKQPNKTLANHRQSTRHHRVMLLVAMILMMLRLIPCAQADILVYQMLNDQIIEEFRDLPATFGGDIPDSGLKVLADKADPPDGCMEMRPAPNSTSKFAVVISRYNCSFEVKVRNAQQAGYAMVIVHNVGSNDLEHMSANHPQDLLIPSVFVGESSGRSIIEMYLYDRGYALVITDDIPFNISNNLIIPFAIVVGLCFIIMVLFMIIRCIRERRRRMRHRLPARVLRRIGIVKFAKGMNFDVCAICLEDFVENERLRVLPCRHAYHAICIDPWLTKNRRVCPICKRKVIIRGEARQRRYSSDSMSSTNADESTPLLNSSETSGSSGGGAAAAAVVTAPPATSSSTPATPGNAVPPSRDSGGASAQVGAAAQTQREQQQLQQNAVPSSHVMEVPPSDDDDELLDDRNVPSARWLLRGRTSSQQQQQQQQQPLNESPYSPIGDNVVSFPRWRFFQRFFTRSSTQAENVADIQQEPPPNQSPSSSPANPPSPVGTGNNILNSHLSGWFHGSEDTTDDELLDAMRRDRTKHRQFRSAPDMPSTSVGARIGVIALPNVNFNPVGGAAAATAVPTPPTPQTESASADSNTRVPRRSRRQRRHDTNGNNSHIV